MPLKAPTGATRHNSPQTKANTKIRQILESLPPRAIKPKQHKLEGKRELFVGSFLSAKRRKRTIHGSSPKPNKQNIGGVVSGSPDAPAAGCLKIKHDPLRKTKMGVKGRNGTERIVRPMSPTNHPPQDLTANSRN